MNVDPTVSGLANLVNDVDRKTSADNMANAFAALVKDSGSQNPTNSGTGNPPPHIGVVVKNDSATSFTPIPAVPDVPTIPGAPDIPTNGTVPPSTAVTVNMPPIPVSLPNIVEPQPPTSNLTVTPNNLGPIASSLDGTMKNDKVVSEVAGAFTDIEHGGMAKIFQPDGGWHWAPNPAFNNPQR